MFPDTGPAACPGAVLLTAPGETVGQLWARSAQVSGLQGLGDRAAWVRAAVGGAGPPGQCLCRSRTSPWILRVVSGPAVSHRVQLWHGRMTDGVWPGDARICGPAGGRCWHAGPGRCAGWLSGRSPAGSGFRWPAGRGRCARRGQRFRRAGHPRPAIATALRGAGHTGAVAGWLGWPQRWPGARCGCRGAR